MHLSPMNGSKSSIAVACLPTSSLIGKRSARGEALNDSKTHGHAMTRFEVRPVKMDLSGPEGTRVVLAAARRVMVTHAKVLKALAKR